MDCYQPATASMINSSQNKGMLTRSKLMENVKSKRKRQELQTRNVNSLQNEGGLLPRSGGQKNPRNKRHRSERESNENEIAETKSRTQETNPLKMGSILEKIFGYLDAKSIKTARQVDKFWNSEGAKVLITKCYLQIPLVLQRRVSPRRNNTLVQFQDFLAYKSSQVSMIPKIAINSVVDIELWESLGVLGHQVKSLKLNLIDGRVELLLSNLMDLLPNLEYLSLKDCEQFEVKQNAIIKVLTSVMSKPEKRTRPLLLSDMTFSFDNFEEFEDMEKFSECNNIKIQGFKFLIKCSAHAAELEVRVANILSKLLHTSRNTLKKLSLLFCEKYMPLVQFPCMTTLTNMELLFFPQTPSVLPQYRFSPCFRFSEKVPNLDDVVIAIRSDGIPLPPGTNLFVNLFETTGTAPSVRNLMYYDTSVGFTVDPLFQMFPNTECISITPSGHMKRIFDSICKHGSNIKTLDITIYFDQHFEEIADLDSIFTGFAPGTVDTIRKLKSSPSYTPEELTKLRVNPSILDLKELKCVSIRLNGWMGRWNLPNEILAIAGEYAFKYLPCGVPIVFNVEKCWPTPDCVMQALDEVSKLPNVFIQSSRGIYKGRNIVIQHT